ncbi:yrdC domain-containing protein, mitochondrial [Tribolium madens]|uniref:yrdC domain-containing protein, mitochondrial n=1 Tax=Tribolium madens TaxID=41895 RepID=UPI001CF766BD|nr:yrdC domain-containing protein, mitochondrial [Tribolium madens]
MALHVPIGDPNAEVLAVDVLKLGRVIAVPTDTVYGLACDATNLTSVNKLYSIKGRNEHKPVAICLGDVLEVKTWAKVEHLPKGLLESLFPGPVTVILTCANKLDKSLSFNTKVGIRIPDYHFIRALARGLGRPLALTSANLSNEPSSLTIHEFQDLWDKLGAVFDGGKLGNDDLRRRASTVIDLSECGLYTIVRQGIAVDKTIAILHRFGLFNKHE